jgi:hypothetical protein
VIGTDPYRVLGLEPGAQSAEPALKARAVRADLVSGGGSRLARPVPPSGEALLPERVRVARMLDVHDAVAFATVAEFDADLE